MATYLLAPGDSRRWYGGGFFTILRLADAVGAEVVTYEEASVEGRRHLDEVEDEGDATFVVCWGSHVAALLERLAGRRAAYWANSVGWGMRIPPEVPVLAASRFTLGYWAENAPASPLYLLPNIVEDVFHPGTGARDLDVLVAERKTSPYVLERLVPALEGRGLRVEVLREHVDDLASVYRRARVFLYDSREHWLRKRMSEGFGLPPLEAAACGCAVFTSLNAGLSDFVDPGHGWSQIAVHDLAHDVERIVRAVEAPGPPPPVDVSAYRPDAVRRRWEVITAELDVFWRERGPRSDVPGAPAAPRRYDPVPATVAGRMRRRVAGLAAGDPSRSRR